MFPVEFPTVLVGFRSPTVARVVLSSGPIARVRGGDERLGQSTVMAGLMVFLGAVGCAPAPAPHPEDAAIEVFRDRRQKMGTHFEIQIRGASAERARAAIDAAFAEIDRVEARLSEWREDSDISELNRMAGRTAVPVGEDLRAVLERSREISRMTDGAFDVTLAACSDLWSFREPVRVAEPAELEACREHVGWRKIEVRRGRSTVRLPDPAMRVGISGIGKGYGVDRAADVLESRGIHDYIVDGGGDIRLAATPGSPPWTVGIANPRRTGELWGSVSAVSGAVVTSGDYEAYFVQDGTRYHHVLDPGTGSPSREASAVTVTAPDAATADALATGLMVLGPERGVALVEQLPGVEALFLVDDREHSRSSGFPTVRPIASTQGG